MQFKQDAKVFSSDSQDVGHIERVVLNPRTKEVTHLVVRRGLLFTEDKLIPIDVISSAVEEGVSLRLKAVDLDALPPFEETHYIPLNASETEVASYAADLAMPMYWYMPYGAGAYIPPYVPPYQTETIHNTPENTVAVKEGARVISSDGQDVGGVEQVFTDPKTDRATHLLLAQGLLLKTKKSIPMSWVRNVAEDELRLYVSAALLEDLHEYQEA